jgi:hypothetical protein
VHLIDLASPAASGRKAASHSRVSLVSFGRFHAGQHHQRLGLRVLLQILHQATVARRIRTTVRWPAKRAKRVMVVPTLNSGAVRAITPTAHHHHLPFRPRLHLPSLLLLLLHKSLRLSYWVLLPRLPSLYYNTFQLPFRSLLQPQSGGQIIRSQGSYRELHVFMICTICQFFQRKKKEWRWTLQHWRDDWTVG